ncbi:MAG: LysR family transcriptional regulator [Sphingomonadales bacterium]
MNWEKLKIFHLVAEAGSFTAAARRLNVSQSSLSRQIKDLEATLGTALFTRHARGIVLTAEGEQLFATATDVREQIDAAQQSLFETGKRVHGPLRVTTTVSFGTVWLVPRLAEFRQLYPAIRLELLLSDDDVDLATREADVAIRMHAPHQADLIQRPLVPIHHHIYASPAYLNQKGTPERAEDLDQHDLIAYGPEVPTPIKDINWLLTAGSTGFEREPVLAVNNLLGVLEAIKAGLGLAAIPDYLAAESDNLVRVLSDLKGPSFRAHFVYPSELKRSKRVMAFRDFLVRIVKEDKTSF